MYTPGDIVAVYGESVFGNTLYNTHQNLPNNVMAANEQSLQASIENASKYAVCCVERVFQNQGKTVLYVSTTEPIDGLDGGRRFLVSARQVRIMRKSGRPVDMKEAIYLGLVHDHDEEKDYWTRQTNLERAVSYVVENREAIGISSSDGYVYKGIDISSEVLPNLDEEEDEEVTDDGEDF